MFRWDDEGQEEVKVGGREGGDEKKGKSEEGRM